MTRRYASRRAAGPGSWASASARPGNHTRCSSLSLLIFFEARAEPSQLLLGRPGRKQTLRPVINPLSHSLAGKIRENSVDSAGPGCQTVTRKLVGTPLSFDILLCPNITDRQLRHAPMPDIRFKCPKCTQSLEAPEELAGQLIDCPTCKETIEVPIHRRPTKTTAPPPPIPLVSQPPSPQQRPAIGRKIKKGEFVGVGAAVQAVGCLAFLVGILLCTTVLGMLFGILGIIIGLLLLIIGRRMAIKWLCSNCGNKLSGKEVRICPVCHCQFDR